MRNNLSTAEIVSLVIVLILFIGLVYGISIIVKWCREAKDSERDEAEFMAELDKATTDDIIIDSIDKYVDLRMVSGAVETIEYDKWNKEDSIFDLDKGTKLNSKCIEKTTCYTTGKGRIMFGEYVLFIRFRGDKDGNIQFIKQIDNQFASVFSSLKYIASVEGKCMSWNFHNK